MNEKTLNNPDKKHTWSNTIRHWLDRLYIYKKRLFISLWNDKKNLLLFALFVFICTLFEEYITDRARYYIMLLPMDYHLSLLSKILFLILMSAPLYFLLKAFENRYYVPPSLILCLIFLAYVYANITLSIVPPSYLTRVGDFIFSYICLLVLTLGRNILFCDTIKEPKEKTLLISDFAIEDEEDDRLDFLQGVKFLAGELEKFSPKRSYSIGIVGAWGSGKSSYLNLLEKSLDRNKFIIVKFNPRHSLNACTIQEDFFHELFSTLKKYDSRFSSSFKEYLKAINIISENKFLSSFMSVHEVWNKEDEKNKINRALERLAKRVVVFIDDFDRLLKEEIIEVLKLIDGNASFSNMIFITAYDKKHLNSLLDCIYTEDTTMPFSDKFFSTEVYVPHRPYSVYIGYLIEDLSECFSNEEESRKCTTFLRIKERLIARILPTFRDIKRFLNQFKAQYKGIKQRVVFEDYFLLHLIKYKWYDEYQRLRLGEYITYTEDSIYLDKHLADKDYSTEESLLRRILKELFPQHENDRPFSIRNPISFDFYFYDIFHMSIITGELYQMCKDRKCNQEKIRKWHLEGHTSTVRVSLLQFAYLLVPDKDFVISYLEICFCFILWGRLPDSHLLSLISREENYNIWQKLNSEKDLNFKDIFSTAIRERSNVRVLLLLCGLIDTGECEIFTQEELIENIDIALNSMLQRQDSEDPTEEGYNSLLSQLHMFELPAYCSKKVYEITQEIEDRLAKIKPRIVIRFLTRQ